MPAAPVFSPKALQGSGPLGGAFAEWTAHYNACQDCQREDWYAPNEGRLCEHGRKLFRTWDGLTVSGE